MTGASIARIAVPSVALVAAGSAALVFAATHLWREPPAEARTVADAQPNAQSKLTPISRAQAPDLLVLATALAETNVAADVLSVPPGSPIPDEPVFDVARIESSGDAVIAGRATPGASVELMRNGEPRDRTVADQSGQFVMVPSRLPPGNYELTLRSSLPDGKQATSKQRVPVALEQDHNDQAMAASATPDAPRVVPAKQMTPNAQATPIAVESVEVEPGGKLKVSGRSFPGAALRLYLNDTYLASSRAAAEGHFAFTVSQPVAPGSYRARLDEIASDSAAIRSRAEVPFDIPQPEAAVPGHAAPFQVAKQQDTVGAGTSGVAGAATSEGAAVSVTGPKRATTVVTRGDSLWRISRATYGAGEQYAAIFGANRAQIRNPNRIYPGQVFTLPEKTH
jgi:nucleoid-associated protein YgaU